MEIWVWVTSYRNRNESQFMRNQLHIGVALESVRNIVQEWNPYDKYAHQIAVWRLSEVSMSMHVYAILPEKRKPGNHLKMRHMVRLRWNLKVREGGTYRAVLESRQWNGRLLHRRGGLDCSGAQSVAQRERRRERGCGGGGTGRKRKRKQSPA